MRERKCDLRKLRSEEQFQRQLSQVEWANLDLVRLGGVVRVEVRSGLLERVTRERTSATKTER